MNTIVHTALRYPPATGGVETYVKELVERTRDLEAGRDVRVLTSSMRTHGPISYLKPKELVPDPMYIQRLHSMNTPLVSYPRLQALDYYLGHHKPDIVHGYSFWYQPADVAARYAKKHNIPFIFHPMYYENEVRQKPFWQVYKKTIGAKTFALADAVVVISPYEQKLIEEAGFKVKRFVLIPPGIDTAKFKKAKAPTRKNSDPTLLMVSRLSEGKGIEDVLHALPTLVKEFPEIKLRIAGEDFGNLESLKKLVNDLGIKQQVQFLGRISDEELVKEYISATAFVHASYYEAFGIVLGEASAAGLPVIARNTSAVSFVVQDKVTGFLFNTQEELIQSVMNVLSNPVKAQKMGIEGKKYVTRQFSWDESIKKLIELYDQLKS